MLEFMPQIHLVRHGQASFEADDYDCLSPLGERQSRLLGDWFGRCGQAVQALHRGTLKRHRQTADGLVEGLPAALRPAAASGIDPGFDEFDHEAMMLAHRPEFATPGAMKAWLAQQAQPRRAFQQLFAQAMGRWMSGEHDADYAETWSDFGARCMQALQRALQASQGAQTLVIVSSGGPISAICQQVLGLPDDSTARVCFGLANSGVTRLAGSGSRLHLAQLNSVAHLEIVGDASLITYR
ncbi:MAG: histidine phosphatase family protein [Pseudomonadota bacterium]